MKIISGGETEEAYGENQYRRKWKYSVKKYHHEETQYENERSLKKQRKVCMWNVSVYRKCRLSKKWKSREEKIKSKAIGKVTIEGVSQKKSIHLRKSEEMKKLKGNIHGGWSLWPLAEEAWLAQAWLSRNFLLTVPAEKAEAEGWRKKRINDCISLQKSKISGMALVTDIVWNQPGDWLFIRI